MVAIAAACTVSKCSNSQHGPLDLSINLEYSEFQRLVLKRVRSLLVESGKVKGSNTDPYTEIGMPRNMTLAKPSGKFEVAAFDHAQHVLSDSSRGEEAEA